MLEAIYSVSRGRRRPQPRRHEANLYDIDAKHGDVICVEDALGYLQKA